MAQPGAHIQALPRSPQHAASAIAGASSMSTHTPLHTWLLPDRDLHLLPHSARNRTPQGCPWRLDAHAVHSQQGHAGLPHRSCLFIYCLAKIGCHWSQG